MRKDLKNKEVDGCTFKPETLTYTQTGVSSTSGDKCLDLYKRKQKGWFMEKAQKSAQDYDYEKSK